MMTCTICENRCRVAEGATGGWAAAWAVDVFIAFCLEQDLDTPAVRSGQVFQQQPCAFGSCKNSKEITNGPELDPDPAARL